jgi:rhodanese-related sulfurtransferase
MGTFSDPAHEVSPERAAELLERGEAEMIDVREPYERAAGHISGSRHLELERLASQAHTIDRERPVIFQCRVGARSAMATAAFRAAGYDAYNLEGGLRAWADRGLPVAPEGSGRVAEH